MSGRAPARSLPALLALLGTLAAPGCGGEGDAGPPSVILVSIDTLRADHVGCYGYGRDTTPNLDRFAREGVLFESHVSSTSWTLPAHAALFTAVPDSVHGCVEATGQALSPEFETLAERFAAGGYATAGFFAGPYLHEAFGLGQGFETYRYCVEDDGTFAGERRGEWANDPHAHRRSHEGVTNDRVYAAARSWIEAHRGEPFFCFVHFWDVHFDFTPPWPWNERFDPDYDGPVDGRNFFFDPAIGPDMPARDREHLIALYDGEIAWTDTFLGELREDLEDWGLARSTVVAVTSDHGTELFDHGRKGHRQTLYDEVIRVPLVLWAPGRVEAGRRVRAQTRSIDVAPTLLELADLPGMTGALGESLMPLARGEAAGPGKPAVSELYSVGARLRTVRTLRDKLWYDENTPGDPVRWFDLEDDPREMRPQVDLDAPRARALHALFLRTVAELREAAARRPGDPLELEVPAAVLEELRANGYVGGAGDEDGDGSD